MNSPADHSLAERPTSRTPTSSFVGEYAIETRGLGHRFGNRWAVRDLDLRVAKGSVYGFLGLNGAGKSTTIRMLLGTLQPHAGQAIVLGDNPVTDDIAVKRRVGYVPDTPVFYEWMTVDETLCFIAHYRKGEWDSSHARHLVDLFELPARQRVGTLSRGQRAKVSLICALSFHPELLLLDEPTLGLDPVARKQFIEGLLAEYMESGRTVLISSHLIHEIAGIVDHIGILKGGKLIRSQPVSELLSSLKRVRLVYENDAPAGYALDGLLRTERQGREALLYVDAPDLDKLTPSLPRMGAETYTIEDLSLEEVFVELVGKEFAHDDLSD